jgi:hypothetical protein
MSQAGGATFATSATVLEQTKNIEAFVATVAIVARGLLVIRLFRQGAPPRRALRSILDHRVERGCRSSLGIIRHGMSADELAAFG